MLRRAISRSERSADVLVILQKTDVAGAVAASSGWQMASAKAVLHHVVAKVNAD